MAKKQAKIRNALDLPLKTQWQQVGSDNVEELKSKLHKFLSPMRLQSFKPPWKEMKRATPMERKIKRKQFLESRDSQQIEQYKSAATLRKNLFIGVNALSRGIENNTVSSGLLAGEVSPKILVKHVVQLARHAKIPVLVLPGLKAVTKESLGFSAIALGFKKDVDSNNDICEYLKSVSAELGTVPVQDDKVIEVKEAIDPIVPEKESKVEPPTFIHLNRPEPFQRAFHPPSMDKRENNVETISSAPSLTVENSCPDVSITSSPSQNERKWGDSTLSKLSSTDHGFSLKRRRDPSPLPKGIETGIKLPKVSFSLTEHHVRYFKPPTVVQIKSNPSKHRKKKKKRKM